MYVLVCTIHTNTKIIVCPFCEYEVGEQYSTAGRAKYIYIYVYICIIIKQKVQKSDDDDDDDDGKKKSECRPN